MLVLVVIAGVLVTLRTEAGNRAIRDALLRLVAPDHGTLTLDGLETDLFTHVTLHGLTLRGPDGAVIVQVASARVGYLLGGLPGRVLVLPSVRIDGVDANLTLTDGGLDIATLWDSAPDAPSKPWSGLGIDLSAPDVVISHLSAHLHQGDHDYGVDDAQIAVDVALRGNAVLWKGLVIDAAATSPSLGALGVKSGGRWDPSTLLLDSLEAHVGADAVGLRGAVGRLDGEPTVGVYVSAFHVEAETLAPLVSELPVVGTFEGSGNVAGLLRAPSAVLDVATPGGPVLVNVGLDLRPARPTWSLAAAPRAVALDAFLLPVAKFPTVVDGSFSVTGSGLAWPDVDAHAEFAVSAPSAGPITGVHAHGTADLAHGVVEVPAVVATADGAAFAGGATLRLLDGQGDARVGKARVDLASLAKFGVPGGRGAVAFTGRASASWKDGSQWARADGAIDGQGVGWGDDLRVATVTGPVGGRWDPGRGASGHATLDLTGLSAPRVTADGAHVDGTGTVDPERRAHVEGTLALTGANGPEAHAERISVEGSLDRAPEGRLDAEANVTTGPLTVSRFGSDHGGGRVRLQGDLATVTLDLLDGERTVFGVDGEADLAKLAVRARRLELAPTPDRAWHGDGVQTARFVTGGVEDLRLRLVSGSSILAAQGHGKRHDLLAIVAEARDVRLSWLADLYPDRFAGYAGRIDGQASFEGDAKHPSLLIALTADDLTLPGVVQKLDLDAQLQGGGRRMQVDASLATGGKPLAHAKGSLPFSLAIDSPGVIPEGDLDLHLFVSPSSADGWNTILPGAPLPPFRGSAEVSLTGPILDPALGLVASVESPLGNKNEWMRADIDAHTEAGLLQVRAGMREQLRRRATIDGSVALHLGDVARSLLGKGPEVPLTAPATWAGDLDLRLVPLRMPLQALACFMPIPAKLSGDLSGGLLVSGTARAPKVQGALLIESGKLGSVGISPALLTLMPTATGYQVEANLGFAGGGTVAVKGHVPFSPTIESDILAELGKDGLDLNVRADDVPLALLGGVVPGFAGTTGVLRLDGTVTGSVLDPKPDLGFGLTAGDFTLAQTAVRYSDVAFQGRMTADTVNVDDLVVHTTRLLGLGTNTKGDTRTDVLLNGQKGGITGTITARRVGDRPALGGKLVFDRAWLLDLPEQVAQVDGTLELSDTPAGVKVVGGLTVIEGQVVLRERFFTKESDLALDPTIRVIRSSGESAAAAPLLDPLALPEWLNAKVKVNLARHMFLDAKMPMKQVLGAIGAQLSSIQVQTQLDGEVTGEIERGTISLTGQVEPLRGTTTVMGKPFAISGRDISFTGRDFLDPVLDLQAVYTTPDYGNIVATIGGTPSAPELSLVSQDGSLAQEDVLGVLLFGKPSSELGSGGGEGTTITSALTTVASSLASSATATTGSRALDLFEFDLSGSLRAGRRIGDRVFLLGTYNFTDVDDDENPIEGTLEWRIDNHWQFDFTTGTAGKSSIGLNRRWRF